MCPSVDSQPPCNRQPFLSESGCDRGSVDIHQFDDLPYCAPINPSFPDIPPEIVDTPLDIVIPPPCTCVNVEYDLDMKYSKNRKFSAKGELVAKGDCCEGNYDAKMELDIPCPVVSEGSKSKKIKMTIGYGMCGKTASASYISLDDKECTVSPKDVDMNLCIPCPVSGQNSNKLKIGISYGKTFKSASASVLNINPDICVIEAAAADIRLNIPCPISGAVDENRIRAVVRHGPDVVSASAVFMHADVNACTMEGRDADLVLDIPFRCPINVMKTYNWTWVSGDDPRTPTMHEFGYLKKTEVSPGITASIKYSDSQSSTKPIPVVEINSCDITPLPVKLNLALPCPLPQDPKEPKIKAKIKYGSDFNSPSALIADVDHSACRLIFPEEPPEMVMSIPCPLSKMRIAATCRIGPSANVVVTSESDPTGCKKTVNLAFTIPDYSGTITVPCPLDGTAGKKTITIAAKVGAASGSAVASFANMDTGACKVSMSSVSMSLNVPCPIKLSLGADLKLGFDTIEFDGMPGLDSLGFDKLLEIDSTECKLKVTSHKAKLKALPPTDNRRLSVTTSCSTTSASTGEFTCESSWNATEAKRSLNFKVKFPAAAKDLDVVTEITWNAGMHELQYTTTNLKTGTQAVHTVFTAAGHMSDHVNCEDK